MRRGAGGAREPRGQGRAARGTEVSVGPPMIRLFRTLIRGGSRPDELWRATVADAVHQAGIYAGKNSKRCQGSWMNFQFSRALPPGGLAHARPDDLEAFPSGLGHAASGTTYLPILNRLITRAAPSGT